VSSPLIIRLIIQTIRRDPTGSDQIDEASDVSRPDRSGSDQIDVEHQATDLVVYGSNRLAGGAIVSAVKRPEVPRRGSVAGSPGAPLHHLSDVDPSRGGPPGSYENGDMSGRDEEVVAATGAVPDAVGSTATATDPGVSPASCWTAKRLRLRDWLERTAPQLAQVYAGAVTMAFDPDFPGRVVFVWHAMREIRNRLPDAVAGEVDSSSLEYGDLAKSIRRCWIEDDLPNDGEIVPTDPSEPSARGPARYEISRELLVAGDALSVGMPRSQSGMKLMHSGYLMLWRGRLFPFPPMLYRLGEPAAEKHTSSRMCRTSQ
jgi:hypothetical protein